MSKKAIEQCIEIAGSQAALVALMKPHLPKSLAYSFRQGHVSNWLRRERKSEVPPAEYMHAMTKAVGGRVGEEVLRPDLFDSFVDDLDVA